MKVAYRSLSIFLLSVGLSASAFAQTVSVPFVACASDGQLGPRPAPKASKGPMLPAAAASRLAWYATDDLGVLGPRGWECLGLYGSDGVTLMVVPNGSHQLLPEQDKPITGQGIQLSTSYGDTSGRFEGAKIAAQLFPNQRAFVDAVAGEGILPKEAFGSAPFPHDHIRSLGPNQASFETPANDDGLGTMSRLMKSTDPIQGMAKINEDNDVTLLVVRLSPALRDLAPSIMGTELP